MNGDGVKFIIHGEPASKANSRRIVQARGRTMVIKSAKALSYREGFLLQVPKLQHLIRGPVAIEMKVYYASLRPDLDVSLILDCLQGTVIYNDRQIVAHSLYRALDRDNPRTEIRVFPMVPTWCPSLTAAVEAGGLAGDQGRISGHAERTARSLEVARQRGLRGLLRRSKHRSWKGHSTRSGTMEKDP